VRIAALHCAGLADRRPVRGQEDATPTPDAGSARAPSFDDVLAASARIRPWVHRTPVAVSRRLDAELGARVFFKCENLQKVGAFKARGAANAVLRLAPGDAAHGVITHSSGNHGAALAWAASVRGVPCVVVMPDDAPAIKVRAVRGYGAEIVSCPRAERDAVCERLGSERGLVLIHPFEHPDVVAGQGTAALELIEEIGPPDVLVAPVGGGGLLSGTTIAAGHLAPRARVVGAEPAAVDDAARSLATGRREPAPARPRSWADGLLTGLGELAFAVLRDGGVRVVTVSEVEILRAAWWLAQRMKLVVEPSGATVLAALRCMGEGLRGLRVGAILSGGNTDFAWLADPALERT